MKKGEKIYLITAIVSTVIVAVILLINAFKVPIEYNLYELITFIMISLFIYIIAYFIFCVIKRILINKSNLDPKTKERKKKIYNELIVTFAIIPAVLFISFYMIFVYFPDRMLIKKPVIYLYPETETNVIVKLSNPEKLTTTYPKYDDSWKVKASSNGDLTEISTGRNFYALYWEGKDTTKITMDEGFVIEGKETSGFLEEKLSLLGLNEREANEFIIYWLPEMENNKYNYIRFRTSEEINEYMKLEVDPTPDSVIRVIMDYKPLKKYINVKEQVLTTPQRTGFTVVEWGGREIK